MAVCGSDNKIYVSRLCQVTLGETELNRENLLGTVRGGPSIRDRKRR